MHRRLVPERRLWLLTASVSVLLVACSSADDEHVEVAGVVLEREPRDLDADRDPMARREGRFDRA